MTTPRSSVVICAYTEERWADLDAAVVSLQRQTEVPDEIIVVIDHNSTLLQRVRARFLRVIALENSGPRGLSGARNTGIAGASGEVVAFLDDDAVAATDWLSRLLAAYTNDRVLGVGGAIAPLWVATCPRWFPAEFGWVVGCGYQGQPQATAAVRNLIGTNMSFRRAVFAAVGGFRDELGRIGANTAGCEETELCIRARQQRLDGVILYVPSARVGHRVPASRATWRYFRSRCYAEGRSKALVTALVGKREGLATERDYTVRTLPLGVMRGLKDVMLHRDPAGFLRAGAIVAGLACTTAGYGLGLLSRAAARRATPSLGAIEQL